MTNPDWENFAKAVLADWPTGDLEGSVLFDLSLQYGMIQEVPGGFNSDHHVDAEGICPEEGDPWYEYTFRGEAGPGLYSINDMTKRIEAQAAEIERLRSYLERIEKASESFTNPEHSELTLSYAHESTRRLAREALTVSATVKESLTTEDEKQGHEWKCPIDYPGCRKNCGSYGCGN